MSGEFYTSIYTGGEEYQIRVDKATDKYYIYMIGFEVDTLVHTSYSKKNMEAFIEDLYYDNVDYDMNL